MEYLVELEPDTQWLAPWAGDPGRTCVRENAKRYKTQKGARNALRRAMNYRPFPRAKIVPV